MALENPTYVPDLDPANPPGTDFRKEGNEHFQRLKKATQQSLALMGSAFTTAGTATALTVTTGHTPAPAYKDGHIYSFILHTNIGVDATVNYDAIGARTLKKFAAGAWANVAANNYKSGEILFCMYKLSDTTMRIVAAAGTSVVEGFLLLTGGTLTGDVTLDTNAQILLDDSVTAAGANLPLAFDGDTNTGMYRKAADSAALAANGADVLAWSPTGVVVTGTLSTSGAMSPGNLSNHTIDDDGTNPIYTFDSSDTLVYTRASNRWEWKPGGTESARIDSDGFKSQTNAKVWIFFDYAAGVPTINDDFNVSSLTDNGLGDTTITFTTALANANYSVSGVAAHATNTHIVMTHASGRATTSLRTVTFTHSNGATDIQTNVTIHGSGVA